MPVYRTARSPYWHFDFQYKGRRFYGTTKTTTRREAEKVEAAERERARGLVAQAEQARTSLRLDDIAGRYWQEHGQHLSEAADAWTRIGRLIEFLGKDKLITEINDDDVTRMVAWRRGHQVQRKKTDAGLVGPFTVNQLVAQLRKLFTRCKLWGVRFLHEPRWSRHMLPVPVERVRELSEDEANRLDAVMRADYAPFLHFAHASGLRLSECILRWSEVDWSTRQIVKFGKGGRRVTVPITSDIRELLWPLRGHHPEYVFTYLCQKKGCCRIKGQRYPITYGGVQNYWKHLRKAAGVTGFRLHDYRHDYASKLLRESRNLRLVQKALNHASIKTTTRYAHVLDHEVADAMEAVAESRRQSRIRLKVV
jgi:integrase